MSRVSYFQRFSQRENHATNNTLLLLRHFYQSSPFKLERALTALTDTELILGLSFEQQVRGLGSVPDAVIRQEPLHIYIETKRGEALEQDQIQRHVQSIRAEGHTTTQTILLGLTREPIAIAELEAFRSLAGEHNVLFAAVTFTQITDTLRQQCAEHEVDLLAMLADYEEFLADDGLLESRNQQMVVFPCGLSLRENQRFGIYYEPATRPYKQNRYIGLYAKKRVGFVGRVETVAVCSYMEGSLHVDAVESGHFTSRHKAQVASMVEATEYYDLKSEPKRFYLVEQFAPTELLKESPHGLPGMRYLDLGQIAAEHFQPRKEYTSLELARLLSGKLFK